jgi:small subunit ribosomal protein S3
MGQKIHPYGFRCGITRGWKSRWNAPKGEFGRLVVEDDKIRRYIRKSLHHAGIASIEIERAGSEVRLLLHTARPGVVIGRKGAEVDRLRTDLESLTAGKKFTINIREITRPEIEAQLVAEAIAEQLVKRVSYRRAVKKAVEATLAAGALGVKITCCGRLGGSEMSRRQKEVAGSLPLQTLTADIDYGLAEAHTTSGAIGVKVWIHRGEIVKDRGVAHGLDAQARQVP